jgi:hypothetical protein
MEMFPGQAGAGFFQVEKNVQGQGGVPVTPPALFIGLQLAAPGLHGRGVMVDLGDRGGDARHLFKPLWRKGEIENVDSVAGQIADVPGFTVMQRAIGGGFAKP